MTGASRNRQPCFVALEAASAIQFPLNVLDSIKIESGDAPCNAHSLRPNLSGSCVIPGGSGSPMAIFGLADANTTWEKFLQSISGNRYHDSWREAIASVVMSSFPDHINVDNSQIIVSSDEAKTYRVILTSATKYYDDNREFSIILSKRCKDRNMATLRQLCC